MYQIKCRWDGKYALHQAGRRDPLLVHHNRMYVQHAMCRLAFGVADDAHAFDILGDAIDQHLEDTLCT